MKKLMVLFGFYLIVNNIIIIAQTNVPGGEVNGTWTMAYSPYFIQGAIMIANGNTLTIEPGVSVIFQGGYKFLVLGRLLAVGTLSDSITFTATDTVTGWRGIRFDNTTVTNDSSILQYCKFYMAEPQTLVQMIMAEDYILKISPKHSFPTTTFSDAGLLVQVVRFIALVVTPPLPRTSFQIILQMVRVLHIALVEVVVFIAPTSVTRLFLIIPFLIILVIMVVGFFATTPSILYLIILFLIILLL